MKKCKYGDHYADVVFAIGKQRICDLCLKKAIKESDIQSFENILNQAIKQTNAEKDKFYKKFILSGLIKMTLFLVSIPIFVFLIDPLIFLIVHGSSIYVSTWNTKLNSFTFYLLYSLMPMGPFKGFRFTFIDFILLLMWVSFCSYIVSLLLYILYSYITYVILNSIIENRFKKRTSFLEKFITPPDESDQSDTSEMVEESIKTDEKRS